MRKKASSGIKEGEEVTEENILKVTGLCETCPNSEWTVDRVVNDEVMPTFLGKKVTMEFWVCSAGVELKRSLFNGKPHKAYSGRHVSVCGHHPSMPSEGEVMVLWDLFKDYLPKKPGAEHVRVSVNPGDMTLVAWDREMRASFREEHRKSGGQKYLSKEEVEACKIFEIEHFQGSFEVLGISGEVIACLSGSDEYGGGVNGVHRVTSTMRRGHLVHQLHTIYGVEDH